MKVIFVGLHNKPDKQPLDSSTKSGKLIDRIINEGAFDAVKTNLFDLEFIPKTEKLIVSEQAMWCERSDYQHGNIVVLLGNDVKKYFGNIAALNSITIYHPASRRSHQQMNDYVKDAIEKINQIINPS